MILIKILKAFLEEGFQKQETVKIAYCFCDGLLNVMESGKKDKQDQTKIESKFEVHHI